ncbi:MAG: saccharopine dehydrogenase NADP-binding domain-containing protein [Thermoleophilia bacterium]
MKVLQLGVGSVGEVIARTIAREPEISTVVLADIDAQRVDEVAGAIGAKAQRLKLDVNDGEGLARALREVDFAVNALVPRYNLDVMNACLETATNYLDMATAGPRDVVGTADVDEQLALDAEFRRRDLTALLCLGIDPGATDVFARHLYDQLDTVERFVVLDGDTGQVEGFDVACSFSPDTMLEECTLPPTSFDHGKSLRYEPLSRSFEFDFPAPVGRLRVWNTDHEESELVPWNLSGKGLQNVDFFIHLDEDWVAIVRALRKLGLDSTEPLSFKGATFSPREFVVSRLPKAVDLKGHVKGDVCVGTLAEGSCDGRPVCRYAYQVTSHEEAFARLGVQGTGYQTGIPAAAGVILFARGVITQRGTVAPERLDPESFLAEMSRLGCPWQVVDLPPESIAGLRACAQEAIAVEEQAKQSQKGA